MFLRQTLLYLPAQVIGPLFQFLAVVAWTFWLRPEELGQLNLIIALQELLFLPTLYWWSHYTLRSLEKLSSEGRRGAFERMEPLVVAIGLVVNAVAMVATVLLFVDAQAGWPLLAAAMAYGVSRGLLLVLVERARAAQQIALYTVLQIAASAVGLLIGLALVATMGNNAIWPLIGFAAAQTFACLFVLPRIGLRWSWPAFDRGIITEALRYGAPLTLASAITWVALYGQRFIVDMLLDRAQVGLYSVGAGIADRSLMFIAFLVAPAIFPLAIRDVEEAGMPRAMARLADGLTLGLILIIPAVVGLAVLAEPVSRLILGEQYRLAAASLLPAAALAAGLQATWTLMPAQTLMLHKRTQINVLIETAGAVTSIILGLLLVRSHGVLGAAYARVGASTVVLAIGITVGIKVFQAVYPWQAFAAAVCGSLVMAAALHWIPLPQSLLGLIGHILAGAAVYGTFLAVVFRERILAILAGYGLGQR